MIGKLKTLVRRRPPGWNRRKAGNAARDARNWAAAGHAYGDYLALNPNDAAIWVQYGHVVKEAGDFAGAERAYRRAAAIDRDAADPLFHLGVLMKRQDRRDQAIVFYQRCAALGFEPAVAELSTLGVTYDPAKVAPQLEYDPSLLRTLMDAQAARDLHRWEEADRLYTTYLRAVPGSAQASAELTAMRKVAGRKPRSTVRY